MKILGILFSISTGTLISTTTVQQAHFPLWIGCLVFFIFSTPIALLSLTYNYLDQ